MRRAILAVTVGGVLLAASACDSASDTTATSASTAPAPVVSTAPSIAVPDYTANNKVVCGKVNKILKEDLNDFATDLGKMVANKEAKLTPEADKAQKDAAAVLKSVGTNLRTATASAQSPELKTAGATSAAKFLKSAGDDKFFDAIKTQKDINKVLDEQTTEWFTPVAGFCAAP